ncbi:MAG: hypothetical protein RIQ60_34 [Pseudomonadota bacterium]|jgi:hemerythrin-like domain-containing protein
MTTPTSPADLPAEPATAEPLATFAQCHVGIVSELEQLDQLPALLDPALRARQIAARVLAFFPEAVITHHREEEAELFTAVLASAEPGPEHEQVRAVVDQLVHEHRQIEAAWAKLEPELKAIAKGHDSHLPAGELGGLLTTLVNDYRGHAHFEEMYFLPLSQSILGRNGNHMAALGLALHTRHALADPASLGPFHV